MKRIINTTSILADARQRIADATDVVARVRRYLADDLDTPKALAALDGWATDALSYGGHDAAAGATVVAHDPMFSGSELSALGFTPLGVDTVADAAVVQADHVEYRALEADLRSRLGLIIDGRDDWPATSVIGTASAFSGSASSAASK